MKLHPTTIEHNKPLEVGSETQKLVWGIFKKKGCGCEEMAAEMNAWGPDGCEEHIQEIVEHFVQQSNSFKVLRMIPRTVRQHQAESWVRQAIETVRDAQEKD